MQFKCNNPKCNNKFEIKKKGNPRKWCSLRCRNLYLQDGYEEEYDCERCGKKYIRTVTPKLINSGFIKRHCSKNCVNYTYNKKHYKSKRKSKRKIICGNPKCDNKVLTSGVRKYCSSKCVATAQYWRERAYDPEYHKRIRVRVFSNKVKDLFFAFKGNKCEKCGTSERLEIHHTKYTTDYKDWKCYCIPCHRKHHNS